MVCVEEKTLEFWVLQVTRNLSLCIEFALKYSIFPLKPKQLVYHKYDAETVFFSLTKLLSEKRNFFSSLSY